MKHADFDKFLDELLHTIRITLNSRSSDYSAADDKIFNFKLQGRIDGISSIEALRGNWLKHRASICQGLDEIRAGGGRPYKWWEEKCVDDINYCILMLAMILSEEYK